MPKYRVPSYVTKEYSLDAVHALPTGARARRGIKTTCAACGQPITSEMFYAGFAPGQPNRMFHFDCLDELSQAIVTYPKCSACGEGCREGQGECLGNYIHFKCKREHPEGAL